MRRWGRILFALAIGTIAACGIGPKQEDPTAALAEDAGASDSEYVDPFLDGGAADDAGNVGDGDRGQDATTSGDTAPASPPCAPNADAGDADSCEPDAASDASGDAAHDTRSDAAHDTDGGDVATGG